MKEKINSYFAVLIITIAGSAAAMLIIHIAYSNASVLTVNSETQYAQLQQSILKP